MNGQPIATQRLPVAMEALDEPLYVNAKQYHRIIKRRQARAKLEAEGKIPKVRKVSKLIMFWYIQFNFCVSNRPQSLFWLWEHLCDRCKFLGAQHQILRAPMYSKRLLNAPK